MKTIPTSPVSLFQWVFNCVRAVISKRLPATFSLALLLTFNVQGQGIIWSVNHTRSLSDTTGGAPPNTWQIAFDHVSDPVFSTPPSLNPLSRIFSTTLLTNDAGHTLFANDLNEPGFAGFVAGLTDGTNNYIRFQAPNTSSWELGLERLYLGRSSLAPDFAGYNITQVGFRVNSFYDTFDASENRYFRNLDYSLDFYGAAVPEPGTWAMLGLGSALLWSATRRPRK